MKDELLKKYLEIQEKYIPRKITLKQLAKEYNLTRERVRQIVNLDLKAVLVKRIIKYIKIHILYLKSKKEREEIVKRRNEILKGVIEDYNQKINEKNDLMSFINSLPKNRKKETVEIKREIAWRLRLQGWSYPEIGRIFGHKDHSTAMFWVKTYGKKYGERSEKKMLGEKFGFAKFFAPKKQK